MTGRQRHQRPPDPTTPPAPGARFDRAAFEREFPGTSGSAAEAAAALVRTAEAFLGPANRALQRHRLSVSGRQVLAVLDGAQTPLPAGEIAARLLVTTASMTTVLDTLERRGLLTRAPDPDDRRRVLVALTPAGGDVVDHVLPDIAALQTAAYAAMPGARRDELVRLLTELHGHLGAVDADAAVRSAPRRRRRPGGLGSAADP